VDLSGIDGKIMGAMERVEMAFRRNKRLKCNKVKCSVNTLIMVVALPPHVEPFFGDGRSRKG